MEGDVKEIVGALMLVLGGGEITREEIEDLTFDAEGELETTLNEAYIRLLEFAFDHDAQCEDERLDHEKRAALQGILDKIVRLSDARASN